MIYQSCSCKSLVLMLKLFCKLARNTEIFYKVKLYLYKHTIQTGKPTIKLCYHKTFQKQGG